MSYIAPPVNQLTDFQLEFGGVLMGNNTPFYTPPDGTWAFLDLASLKTMDDPRMWADGSYSGPDYADVLLPTVSMHIDAADAPTFASLVQTYLQTFNPQTAAKPLWIKMPNLPPLGIGAKTNKRTLPATNLWSVHAEGAVQWRCTDPVWQSVARTITLTASGAALSGLVFPLFTPAAGTYTAPGALDFGSTATSSASGNLTNAGNTPAWPVITVAGPVAGGFTVTIDGNAVTYTGTLAASDSLVIDYATGLATLNGTADRTTLLTSRSFSAVPAQGSSSVFFTATAGVCQVTTADMWR